MTLLKAATPHYVFLFSVLSHALPGMASQRWNNTAFIQIPPSQPVCRPRGGFALAVPPRYWCILRFIALISSTPSYYKHISEKQQAQGQAAGRQWRVWYLAFENKEAWGKDQNGNDPALPSCSRVSSCTRLPITRASWHRGHHLPLWFFPISPPMGCWGFEGAERLWVAVHRERMSTWAALCSPEPGLARNANHPIPSVRGMPQGLLKARGVERVLAPERKVEAGPIKIRKAWKKKNK